VEKVSSIEELVVIESTLMDGQTLIRFHMVVMQQKSLVRWKPVKSMGIASIKSFYGK
jgi:hypothetical protein